MLVLSSNSLASFLSWLSTSLSDQSVPLASLPPSPSPLLLTLQTLLWLSHHILSNKHLGILEDSHIPDLPDKLQTYICNSRYFHRDDSWDFRFNVQTGIHDIGASSQPHTGLLYYDFGVFREDKSVVPSERVYPSRLCLGWSSTPTVSPYYSVTLKLYW